jgi:hypothetical protein
LKFNTLYSDLKCLFCQAPIESGVGFCVGALESRKYHLGEDLNWEGETCRPNSKPTDGRLSTIGYFNCDSPSCASWTDCFPDVQQALIEIVGNRIEKVSVYNGVLSGEKFEILDANTSSQTKE